MSDDTRVKLGWNVPALKLERFEHAVESEWGKTSPYVGIQIEQSWREYRRSEEQNRLEALADDIVEATGRSPDRDEKKIPSQIESSETDQIWYRVHKDVKNEMSAYATECNVPKHVVLEGVLDWYLDGGREQSVVDKLAGVVDDIQDTFATVNGDSTEIGTTERTTIAIANRLKPHFNENTLTEAINEETSGTDHYHQKFTDRVIDYKGVKRLEQSDGPDVFLRESAWKERKVGEIIRNLEGDVVQNTAPKFSRQDFADAVGDTGIEVTDKNSNTINEYREMLLERIDFKWNEETKQFEPKESNTTNPEFANFSIDSAKGAQSQPHTSDTPIHLEKSRENTSSVYQPPQLKVMQSGALSDHISYSEERNTTPV